MSELYTDICNIVRSSEYVICFVDLINDIMKGPGSVLFLIFWMGDSTRSKDGEYWFEHQ
jgi:hypothetical protein